MLKILICCGGGFSSSYVTQRMQKEIIDQHLENEYQIDFYPFSIMNEKMNDYDVIFLCPHLKIEFERFASTHTIDKPCYLIPPRMYGRMELEEVVTDAKDVVDLYNKNKINPVTFKGEENLLRIRRYKAYRHEYMKGD